MIILVFRDVLLLVLAHQTVANGDDRISREAGLIDGADNGVSGKEKAVVSAPGETRNEQHASIDVTIHRVNP